LRKEMRTMEIAVIDWRKVLPWLVFSFFVSILFVFPGRLVRGESGPPQEVEVRDYQGARLGSIDDFRENSIEGVQRIDPEAYRLVVDGLVAEPQAFTYAEIKEQTHSAKVVTIHCVEGWSVKVLWEGIPLALLFEKARPSPEANTVVFYAQDGYSTSLPLQEVLDRDLLLADRMNGLTLPAERGFPFQLVAEDKWGYKWIKWVTRIELSSDSGYRGYWESRGYSNSGDLSGPRFGP
jgi:DMSO/TMAO reductase YedYZ molybdopterin-dependent catalytic subunit